MIQKNNSKLRKDKSKKHSGSRKKGPGLQPSKGPGFLSTKVLIILAIVFIIGIGLTTFMFYKYYAAYDYKEIAMQVEVTSKSTAFNTSTQALTFGKNVPGGGGERFFHIHADMPVKVHIVSEGDITAMITLSENDFVMAAGDDREVHVYLDIPDDAVLGNYTGTLKVYFFRR